jgi:hypothetical protein
MDTSRRAFLEAILEAPDTSTRDRLTASQLLDRLDERAEREHRTTAEVNEEHAQALVDDPDRLAKMIDLSIEHGLFDGFPAFQALVQRRAQELVKGSAPHPAAALPGANTEPLPGTEEEASGDP